MMHGRRGDPQADAQTAAELARYMPADQDAAISETERRLRATHADEKLAAVLARTEPEPPRQWRKYKPRSWRPFP